MNKIGNHINKMTIGHPFDYDNWSQITGETQWSYDEILPYFKKSETFTGVGDGK